MLSKSAVRSSLTLTVLAVLGASTIGTAPFQPNFFVSSAKAAEAPTQGQLPDFVSLVEQNGPAVVNIQTVRKARKISVTSVSRLISVVSVVHKPFLNSAVRAQDSSFRLMASS